MVKHLEEEDKEEWLDVAVQCHIMELDLQACLLILLPDSNLHHSMFHHLLCQLVEVDSKVEVHHRLLEGQSIQML